MFTDTDREELKQISENLKTSVDDCLENKDTIMFTDTDREELKQIFENLKTSVDDCLENHDVLPSSITHNGKHVGITIEFNKIYPLGELSEPQDE